MEPATVLILGLGTLVLGVAGYSVYLSFGPPSAELDDPFEDHED